MRRLAYKNVKGWLGVDKDRSSPEAIHADNTLVLRSIDLSRFNVFDIDAFGMPWHQAWIISQRRPIEKGEKVGIAMTSGASGHISARSPNLKHAGWSTQMLDAIGIDSIDRAHRFYTGRKFADQSAQQFIRAWFHTCSIDYWVSADVSDTVWYFGCVLHGT